MPINEMPTKCPFCNAVIEYVEDPMSSVVMDASSIFQCKKDKLHRFWIHPFHSTIIHWNPDASEDNLDSFLSWQWYGALGKYELILTGINVLVNTERSVSNLYRRIEDLEERIKSLETSRKSDKLDKPDILSHIQ